MDEFDPIVANNLFESIIPKEQFVGYFNRMSNKDMIYTVFSTSSDSGQDKPKPKIMIEPDEMVADNSEVIGICRVFWKSSDAMAYAAALRKIQEHDEIKAFPLTMEELVTLLSRLNKNLYLQSGRCIRAYTYTSVNGDLKCMDLFWTGETEIYH